MAIRRSRSSGNCASALLGILAVTAALSCSRAPSLVLDPQPRVVLAEFFTFALCVYCPYAEEALDSLRKEYHDSLAIVAYHRQVLGDTLSPASMAVREALYGITVSPIVVFDGTEIIQTTDPAANYVTYKGVIDARRNDHVAFIIEGSLTPDSQAFEVSLAVAAVDTGMDGTYGLFLMVCEDSVYSPLPGAPDSTFDFVVRYIEESQGRKIDIEFPDTTWNDFTVLLDPNWREDKLSFIAFLQDTLTNEVYQALILKP